MYVNAKGLHPFDRCTIGRHVHMQYFSNVKVRVQIQSLGPEAVLPVNARVMSICGTNICLSTNNNII